QNASMLIDFAIGTYTSKIRKLTIGRYEGVKDKFSYTRYDALGRIIEAGQMTATDLRIDDNGKLVESTNGNLVNVSHPEFPYTLSPTQTQVTRTLYDSYDDEAVNSGLYYTIFTSNESSNTRNRVTIIYYFDIL